MASSPVKSDERRVAYPPLLSLAVHEFRTPAGVVAGYLRLLLRDGGEPLTDQQRKMLVEAEKSCTRLAAIVTELSDISKLDSGAIALTRQPLDVFALVHEVAAHMHEASDREVHLEVRGEPSGAPAIGDAVRLRAAFNAVLRAILREKAGPCTVIAETRRVQRDGRPYAFFVVAEDRDAHSVYDGPAAAFDDGRGGLGLALPLAVRVIEGHGGRIWSPLRSDADGRSGGSAGISIPIAE